MMSTATTTKRPNLLNRIRSRQASHPSGVLGRIIGRAMVKDTAHSNDRAIDLLSLAESSTVLDVGFGQGRTAELLVTEGHRVLGVDVSVTMVSQAQSRNRAACNDGRAELVHGDGRTVPFDDSSADAALTAHTIYFMDDPLFTLSEICRVLRPGGRLVIACRVTNDELPGWVDSEVYRFFSSSEIEELLESAGFDSVMHHSGGAPEYWTHWFVADAI